MIPKLFQITEDTPEITIQSHSVEFILYKNEIIHQPSTIIETLPSLPNIAPITVETKKESSITTSMKESNRWSCIACTYSNPTSNSNCEICGTFNPNRMSLNEEENDNIIDTVENTTTTTIATATTANPIEYAIWMCGHCTFMNQSSLPR